MSKTTVKAWKDSEGYTIGSVEVSTEKIRGGTHTSTVHRDLATNIHDVVEHYEYTQKGHDVNATFKYDAVGRVTEAKSTEQWTGSDNRVHVKGTVNSYRDNGVEHERVTEITLWESADGKFHQSVHTDRIERTADGRSYQDVSDRHWVKGLDDPTWTPANADGTPVHSTPAHGGGHSSTLDVPSAEPASAITHAETGYSAADLQSRTPADPAPDGADASPASNHVSGPMVAFSFAAQPWTDHKPTTTAGDGYDGMYDADTGTDDEPGREPAGPPDEDGESGDDDSSSVLDDGLDSGPGDLEYLGM
ncbi:hypothetical protein ACQPXH_15810 [Nocardia sp. CA-135953]|uniref:hypothetical protein n=1 Tax=Nocardia sp. CA-135953 TaxID=3239978 RepID=UPI003D953E18